MNNPLVSLIIPTYNRGSVIKEMLDSIIRQTYSNWECIIVDDGSTDDTRDILKEYIDIDKRFQYHQRPNNRLKGGNAARNYGFEVSKGDYINWLDSDDSIDENFILFKVNAFEDQVDILISKTILIKEDNTILKRENRTNLTDHLFEDFITLNVSWYIVDPMWRRQYLLGINIFFNEQLLKGQDRDFHIRILVKNPVIKILDKYLFYYKMNSKSISTSNSPEIAYSILKESLARNKIILNYGVGKDTKYFLIKQQLRLYCNLYNKKGIFLSYNEVFKDLFVFDFRNFLLLLKFIVGVASFKLFGKGDKIFKLM